MSEQIQNLPEAQLTQQDLQERLESAFSSVDTHVSRDEHGFITEIRTADAQIKDKLYMVSLYKVSYEDSVFKSVKIRALKSSEDEDAKAARATTISWEFLPGCIVETYTGFENGELTTKELFIPESDTENHQRVLTKFNAPVNVVE